jgi:CDP-glucose 4,6-dehydratase
MVKKINKFWGTGEYKVEKDNQQHEAELLKLDISKSNYYLKWKPVYAFDDALKITLDWYRNYYITESDMLAQTIEQINNYTKQAEESGLKWTN